MSQPQIPYFVLQLSLLSLVISSGCSTIHNSTVSTQPIKPALTFKYSDRVSINYEKSGKGKKDLVLVHGFGSSIRNWDDVMTQLKEKGALKDFTVYALDMRGAGFSSKPKDNNYTIKENAAILTAFLKKIKIQHPVIVGHSLGGGIALFATVSTPKNSSIYPSKLILIDSACYPTKFPFFISFLRMPVLNHIILKWLPDKFRARKTLEKVVYDKSLITPELVNRYAYFHSLPNYAYALTKTAEQIVPKNAEEMIKKYKEITCPVTIIWGTEDNILPDSLGVRLHKDIPGSELILVPECGHAVPEERPDIVVEAILEKQRISQALTQRRNDAKTCKHGFISALLFYTE